MGFLGYGGGNGGFGGGGGCGGEAGGGGGGDSGGGGGFFVYDGGGGGGSYNGGLANNDLVNLDGLAAHNVNGLSANDGLVTINLVAALPTDVPEPTSLALLALPIGAAGLIAARRRRRDVDEAV